MTDDEITNSVAAEEGLSSEAREALTWAIMKRAIEKAEAGAKSKEDTWQADFENAYGDFKLAHKLGPDRPEDAIGEQTECLLSGTLPTEEFLDADKDLGTIRRFAADEELRKLVG